MCAQSRILCTPNTFGSTTLFPWKLSFPPPSKGRSDELAARPEVPHSLEHRKHAIEEKRHEYERARDQRDFELRSTEAKRSRWSAPIYIALVGAILAGLSNDGVAWWNGREKAFRWRTIRRR